MNIYGPAVLSQAISIQDFSTMCAKRHMSTPVEKTFSIIRPPESSEIVFSNLSQCVFLGLCIQVKRNFKKSMGIIIFFFICGTIIYLYFGLFQYLCKYTKLRVNILGIPPQYICELEKIFIILTYVLNATEKIFWGKTKRKLSTYK